MPELRSRTVTHGRNRAGARALLRASGVASEDIGKPIIAVANSFTEFVPGLYSLPSRDLIADSVEYMVQAHCADALICISNCDKITPGMLMAALRCNIPTVFVSGGPMEGGTAVLVDGTVRARLHLISAITAAAADEVSDADLARLAENACPTCGSCSGMFTANSMNCLTEAIGLVLPGNGSVLATHTARHALYERAGATVVELARRYYQNGEPVLPRDIATRAAFENAMTLDIAMGGSTNTVLHLLAAAREGEVDYTLADIDALSHRVPVLWHHRPRRGRRPDPDRHPLAGDRTPRRRADSDRPPRSPRWRLRPPIPRPHGLHGPARLRRDDHQRRPRRRARRDETELRPSPLPGRRFLTAPVSSADPSSQTRTRSVIRDAHRLDHY